MRKTYNTPHRTRVVKTRLTKDEYADFSRQLSLYGISQAEFIRRAIRGLPIHPIIKVSPVNDELLSAIGKLTAEDIMADVLKTEYEAGLLTEEK